MGNKDYLSDEEQTRFEQQIFSLMDTQDLSFPKGVVYPEKDLLAPVPVKKSWIDPVKRLVDNITTLALKPAFAYVLMLCLVYPAYLGLFREPRVIKEVVREPQIVHVPEPGAVGIGTTQAFALGDGGQRAGATVKEIRLASADHFFTLSFFVPITTEPSVAYNLEIRDAQGALIAEQKDITSRDGLGNFSLVCRSSLFKDGDYILKVLKVNRTRSVVEQDYRFKFRLAHST